MEDDVAYTDAELAALDSISREIDIDAPAERVWELISRPGWWANDGAVEAEPDLRYEDEVAVVTDSTGEYRFRTVALDEPRYAAFRWLGTPSRNSSPGTLVEFWVRDRPQGGVTLRVLESGFSGLSEDPAVWLRERAGNDRGWTFELAAAKEFVESRATSGS
ncbi:hypothetical protein OF117_10475 [Geodermatophilus sp. YIM 151500]|uniref:hypothetical protein n=1 Tax=Geodermatophilus sp. YIM 151500 TaxID=2984531 RepID=UPI0021E4F776|nr:hypothetical protein [Geodermatophilus sp. YIM 151500]MCV2489786.1 hypothetical protein [Geodermatophilus sp. YIM 151500]